MSIRSGGWSPERDSQSSNAHRRYGLDEAGDLAAEADPNLFRISGRLRYGRGTGRRDRDRTVLWVNDRCRLGDIQPEAHRYRVSGRSPLDWAIDSLRRKENRASGIVDDPNQWHVWADRPFNLIRHLRRLVFLSVRSSEIVEALPPSLPVGETD